MTIDRGFDPREFAIMAYGGAGPMHAVELAQELSIGTVLIPPFPGVISAFGLLVAESRFDYVETVNKNVEELPMDDIQSICEQQARRGEEEMQAQEIDFETVESQFLADLHYEGQAHIVQTEIDLDDLSPESLVDWFEAEYSRRYHHTIDDIPVKVRSIRTVTTGYNQKPDFSSFVHANSGNVESARTDMRDVYFNGEYRSTPIFDRFELPRNESITGPCVLEEPDTTIVIPPETSAKIDENGTIVIEVIEQ
jgi:N-methylhydantoinase A